MPRRFPWRRFVAAAAVLAALGALAAAALLRALLPPQRAHALAVDAARRELGREVALDEISVGLSGISVRGLRVSRRPDFKAGLWLSADELLARLSWRALLRGRVVVSRFDADGVRLHLESGRTRRAAPIPSAAPAGRRSIGFDVSRVDLSDSQIEFTDRASSLTWRVSNLALSARRRGLAYDVSSAARVSSAGWRHPIDALVVVRGRLAASRADIDDFSITQGSWTASGSGSWSGGARQAASLDARLGRSGREILAVRAAADIADSGFAARLRAETPEFARAQLADILPDAPLSSLPAVHWSASVSGDAAGLSVSSMTAVWARGKIEGSGHYRRVKPGPPEVGARASLDASLPSVRAGDEKFLAFLRPDARVPAIGVHAALALADGALVVDSATFTVSAGTVSVSGRVPGLLGGAAAPNLTAALALNLPALTETDLPFSGAPAGLRLPPTRWTGVLAYRPGAVALKRLRARGPGLDLEADGVKSVPGAFRGRVIAREFDLARLADLVPAAREFQPRGRAWFDFAASSGPKFYGTAHLRGAGFGLPGFLVSGLNGSVRARGRALETNALSGRLDGSSMTVDAKASLTGEGPEIRAAVRLDRFDLGHYLKAKNAYLARHASDKPLSAAASSPVRASGSLDVDTLLHPKATMTGVHAEWNLTGLGPNLRRLNGRARLTVKGGRIKALGELAAEEKALKVLFFPLLIVQKITSLGGLRLFPDFNDVRLRGVRGDYEFKDGLMTLRRSRMESDEAAVAAAGTIDLPKEELGLVVRAQVAAIAPIAVDITGTFSHPKTKVGLGAFVVDPAKQLLLDMLGR